LYWVGLSALAQPRLTKGGRPYLETEAVPRPESLCPQPIIRFPVSP